MESAIFGLFKKMFVTVTDPFTISKIDSFVSNAHFDEDIENSCLADI